MKHVCLLFRLMDYVSSWFII